MTLTHGTCILLALLVLRLTKLNLLQPKIKGTQVYECVNFLSLWLNTGKTIEERKADFGSVLVFSLWSVGTVVGGLVARQFIMVNGGEPAGMVGGRGHSSRRFLKDLPCLD